MDRMELPEYEYPWYGKIAFGFLCLYFFAVFLDEALAYRSIQAAKNFSAYMIWSGTLFMGGMCIAFIWLLFVKRHKYLLALDPPILVVESRWFGKYSRIKKCELKDAAWVRVNYSNNGYAVLPVEIGTSGHKTTKVWVIPFSQENIGSAEALCADIAHFLKLEDKGYVVGGPRS